MNNERQTRATMQFLAWLKSYSPEVYRMVVERVGDAPSAQPLARLSNGLNGLGTYPGLAEGEAPGMPFLGQIDPFGGVGVPSSQSPQHQTAVTATFGIGRAAHSTRQKRSG